MFTDILKAISEYETIIIHRHSRPDGDAMGSQIGMKHILLENFPSKAVYAVGDDARFFSFMEDSQMDEIPDSVYEGALAIILDTSVCHLISDDRYKLAAKRVRLDHHIFCETIAEHEVVDTSFESCCGLVTQFAVDSGLTINPLAAKSLYTGMVTDSGRFRYDSTTARTFRLASVLMEAGIDTNALFRELYADDFESKKLKASFILKIQFTADNVAYIYTDREEFDALGLDTFTVSRGMVNTMADLKGVSIWVNFTETESGVLCELRSNKYNINSIAVKYGGGGHQKASGATLPDRETAMAMLRDLDDIVRGEGETV
ncbi:MAG: bifunctional oligoribonuclease/PAP phosphatase NrnA [Ruminococcaceae bacterium]|nr:bifunctional oligoribonuclease/PAP phosphatase NrnA [Oscillospiraceae bacterium]